MFRSGVTEHPLTGRPAATLEGVTVQGGEVLRVRGPSGVVFDAGPGLRLAGVVRDSLGAGLAGARVFAPGDGLEAKTGPDGSFELTHLRAGEYRVAYSHPYLEELWYEPDPVEVEVEADGADPAAWVEFEAPATSDVMKDVCRSARPRGSVLVDLAPRPEASQRATQGPAAAWKVSWPNGILMGHVRDAEGSPLAGATVRVLSDAYDMRVFSKVPAQGNMENFAKREGGRGGAVVAANNSGFYRACWVPTNTPLRVAVLADDETLVPGEDEEGQLMANVVAVTEQVVTVAFEEPHATLDLRVERRTPPEVSSREGQTR